jgi:hypothetical protein
MNPMVTLPLDVMNAILRGDIRPCMRCKKRFATHVNFISWGLYCHECTDTSDPHEVPIMNEDNLGLALQANHAIDKAR